MTWAVREKDYSQRRACGLVGLHPKTYRYVTKRSGDEELRRRLRELASQRRRFGYRRLGLMLERQGIKLNHKKLYRLYKEERLTVRKRGGRKRALGTRAPMVIPQGRNLRWSLDFVADTLVSGRRFRILTLVDDFTRECLCLVVDTSLTGLRVVRELDRLIELRGRPRMIVSDNGTELTSNAVLTWQHEHDVEWHYIAPGKPMQNGFVCERAVNSSPFVGFEFSPVLTRCPASGAYPREAGRRESSPMLLLWREGAARWSNSGNSS